MLLLNGDCIEEMQKMIDEGVQVDSVVTDPPYELGFMGKSWDSTGIAFQKETWELAYQLLKPGGHLLAFSSSRTYHRMAVAIEDSGFNIRDQIMWLYGSGFPKSLNIGKAIDKRNGVQGDVISTRKVTSSDIGQKSGWNHLNTDRGDYEYREIMNEHEGWGTALKPAHEPIVMARKPLSESSIVGNVLKHGTGGINIDGCRVDLSEGDDPRLGGKGTWKTDKMANNVYGDYEGKEAGSSELGRFPANVMHDGLKEDWARYFYCPKVSKCERGEDNTHPTVKPQELMKYLCRLVTPKGGIVLDPFMGSGSTGMAAKDEGFDFIGIEQEKEYFEIAESRINITAPLSEFFE
jgi:DNA modification methylase